MSGFGDNFIELSGFPKNGDMAYFSFKMSDLSPKCLAYGTFMYSEILTVILPLLFVEPNSMQNGHNLNDRTYVSNKVG